MRKPYRIDVVNVDESLLSSIQIVVDQCGWMEMSIANEEEYRLTGREVAKFIIISIAAGMIGNSAYEVSKEPIQKIIEYIKENVRKQEKPIELILNGIKVKIDPETDVGKLTNTVVQDIEHVGKKNDQ